MIDHEPAGDREPKGVEDLRRQHAFIFQSISDAVVLTDPQGVITSCNPATETLVGYSAEEIVGRTPALFHLEDEAEMLTQQILATVRRDDQWHGRIRIRRKDGVVRVVETTVRYLRDEQGREIGTVGVNRDVTERDEAERALRDSEERYRLFFASNPLPMILFDEGSLAILDVNQAAVLSYGWSREELLRMRVLDIRPEEQVPVFQAAMQGARNARRVEGRHWHRRKDGTVFPVEVVGFRVALEGRHVWLAMAREITELVAAEAARDEAYRSLTEIIDRSPIAIVGVDRERRVTLWNRTAEGMFGFAAEEVLGEPLPLIPPGSPAEEQLRHALATGETYVNMEVKRRHRDGTILDVLLSSTAITTPDGARSSVAFMIDIGERKRLEEQLRQAQKMEAVGQLAGGVAHDFNNQLTAILGFTRLLEAQIPPGLGLESYVAEIGRAAERSAKLTHQLLAFSRRQVLQPRVLDLGDVVRDTDLLLRRLIGTEVEMVSLPGFRAGRVRADPSQLEQVLINLVVNARDALSGSGRIIIHTLARRLDVPLVRTPDTIPPGHYAILAVSDDGCGMDEATLQRIFEPFFTTKEQGKGTGLGLPMVLGFVKQSGGYIAVQSAPGLGSTVEIYLPRVEEAETPATPVPPHQPVVAHGTVLLAEDDSAIRVLARTVLQQAGYRVLEAENGEEALRLWTRQGRQVDLVLTDLTMPLMGGRELGRRLRAEAPALPILYMSGYAEDLQTDDVRDPSSFLAKPFSPQQLLECVGAAIRTSDAGR